MVALSLVLVPLIGGLLAFFLKQGNTARGWALLVSLIPLALIGAVTMLWVAPAQLSFQQPWLPGLGSSIHLELDGMGTLLCMLTAIAFPLIFLGTWNRNWQRPHRYFGLMLLSQAGLMGVFLAMDALLFYFFWELALIPVYFLCSIWGGERRIQATFKFFIYTFTGSLLMLVALIYMQSLTSNQSFSIESFYSLELTYRQQSFLFWLLFIAFAIKMPIWPFHTWQPDTYEQSPTAVTMVLSGVMVKMGVFALIRWLLPVLPAASYSYGETSASVLAVIGMIYASILAMRQNDIKRLVAYSSIAHIGLMAIAIFAESELALQGVMIQMFNHGIVIIGLWMVIDVIERNYGTKKLSELGGLASNSPALAIFLVILALANIALPLTNSFVGEFMMFTGIFTSPVFRYEIWLTVAAGINIILAAVYTLNMVQKVLYGESTQLTARGVRLAWGEMLALSLIVIMVLVIGIYPQPFLELTESTTKMILEKASISPSLITK